MQKVSNSLWDLTNNVADLLAELKRVKEMYVNEFRFSVFVWNTLLVHAYFFANGGGKISVSKHNRIRVDGAWGPFLESPGNFSGPKSNIQIKI